MDIEQEKQRIEAVLSKVKKNRSKEVEENLFIAKCKNTFQYYELSNGQRTYISKKNTSKLKALARKYYSEQLISHLQHEKETIDSFMESFNQKDKEVYKSLPKELRELIVPYELSDDEYAERWAKVEYETKGVGDKYYLTENGEKVRSKSELTIANKLFYRGIKYRYEAPHYFPECGIFYPDFTILEKHTRQEIILEHFGLMDNPEYVENFLRKMETYALHGLFPGFGLICTFESGKHQLDTEILNNLIDSEFK